MAASWAITLELVQQIRMQPNKSDVMVFTIKVMSGLRVRISELRFAGHDLDIQAKRQAIHNTVCWRYPVSATQLKIRANIL